MGVRLSRSTPPPARAAADATARWTVCAASVPGDSHIEAGAGCDDAFAYAFAGDFVVAAVADGAGSVTGTSAWGSHTATRHVVSAALADVFIDRFRALAVSSEPPDEVLETLFRNALDQVRSAAERLGVPVAKLSTTLAVALAVPGYAAFAQIGDGIIGVERPNGVESVLAEAKSEYANLTWFLQSDAAFDESFRVWSATDVTAFALSTDGMSYKITDVATGAAFVPFFEAAWESVRDGLADADFGRWIAGIEDDQTRDDKTVVLAAVVPANGNDVLSGQAASSPPGETLPVEA